MCEGKVFPCTPLVGVLKLFRSLGSRTPFTDSQVIIFQTACGASAPQKFVAMVLVAIAAGSGIPIGMVIDDQARAARAAGFAVGCGPGDFYCQLNPVDARKTNAPEEEMDGASPRPPCRYGEECPLGRWYICLVLVVGIEIEFSFPLASLETCFRDVRQYLWQN